MHGSFIHNMTTYTYNDGGRHEADNEELKRRAANWRLGYSALSHFTGNNVRDCVTRSLAIISGRPYGEVWQRCADLNLKDGKRHSANHGVRTGRAAFRAYAAELGLQWVQPVQGRFKDMQFPPRCVVAMNGHYTAIVDGVINDTHNPTPAGMAHVFGWWQPIPPRAVGVRLWNVISEATGAKLNVAPLSEHAAATMQTLMYNNYKKDTILKPHE